MRRFECWDSWPQPASTPVPTCRTALITASKKSLRMENNFYYDDKSNYSSPRRMTATISARSTSSIAHTRSDSNTRMRATALIERDYLPHGDVSSREACTPIYSPCGTHSTCGSQNLEAHAGSKTTSYGRSYSRRKLGRTFIPAATCTGSMEGYVFQNGDRG